MTATTIPAPSTSRRDGFRLVAAMAALMWLFEVVDAVVPGDLDTWGIRPRDPDGLVGILTAPFLHAGFGHLIANTIPFLALGLGIALSGVGRVVAVTAIIMLVGGLGTWLLGPEGSVQVGASGVVFGYAAYLISRGIFNRRVIELAGGALVVAVWGTTLLFGLVPTPGVSWQGHLFGALGGVVAASALRRDRT